MEPKRQDNGTTSVTNKEREKITGGEDANNNKKKHDEEQVLFITKCESIDTSIY
jgi:hypothetical protein